MLRFTFLPVSCLFPISVFCQYVSDNQFFLKVTTNQEATGIFL